MYSIKMKVTVIFLKHRCHFSDIIQTVNVYFTLYKQAEAVFFKIQYNCPVDVRTSLLYYNL